MLLLERKCKESHSHIEKKKDSQPFLTWCTEEGGEEVTMSITSVLPPPHHPFPNLSVKVKQGHWYLTQKRKAVLCDPSCVTGATHLSCFHPPGPFPRFLNRQVQDCATSGNGRDKCSPPRSLQRSDEIGPTSADADWGLDQPKPATR